MRCGVALKEALKQAIIERFDKTSSRIRPSSKLKYYEKILHVRKGKLIQNLLLFHRVQDHIYRSYFNFKASKLILNHGKKLLMSFDDIFLSIATEYMPTCNAV